METKFYWKDLYESMKRELSLEDILEIKKAIIAYDMQIENNTDYKLTDEVMDKIIYDGYLYNNNVDIFINDGIANWVDNYAYFEESEEL